MRPWSHLLVSVSSCRRPYRRDQLRLLCLVTEVPDGPERR
jgi:hypothetical protein